MTKPQAEWTILVYIAAHNNLDPWGQRSLNQILAAGSTPTVRLAVLYDGELGARKVIAGAPNAPFADIALGNVNSGDPALLVDTARWAYELCPARHYGLVLWSHGTGWRPDEIQQIAATTRGDNAVTAAEATQRSQGVISPALFRTTVRTIVNKETPSERAICFDDGTQQSLDTLELEKVMTQIGDFIQQPLDLLGLDACVMATLEVAFQLRQCVRSLVASEELVPVTSWPYDRILPALQAQPNIEAHDLARLVVEQFLAHYRQNPPPLNQGDVTQVALDLSQINPVATAISNLAAALTADIINQADALEAVQKACVSAETKAGQRLDSKFKVQLWDLGTLCRGLAQASANPAVQGAASDVLAQLTPGSFVLAEGHEGAWFQGLAGVSIYLTRPVRRIRITPSYNDLALARDTQWLPMMRAYDDEMMSR